MVLVDTSVWIRFFRGQQPFLREMDRLLADDKVVRHELVYGELLIGDSGGRGRFLEVYGQMRECKRIPHEEVVTLVRNHRLHGLGAGWIDIHLLASALVSGVFLWTADTNFRAIGEQFGVDYRPTGGR